MSSRNSIPDTGQIHCGFCAFRSKRPQAVGRHIKEKHGLDASKDVADMKALGLPKRPRRYR